MRDEVRAPMQVGDIVDGRYRLLDSLGEGAAGKVFRAEDLGRGHMFVALKLLHAKDPRWENFFRREFEVLSRLQHPNLVRVYDFGPSPEENTWYFTQELVVGRPLLETVAGKKLDEVVGLFIEICRALEFIHGHGVLHRDLKPANILVQQHAEPGERVRVLDFGLWRELDPTPQKGARWAGTPPYLASEVLRGYGHSISADLYAVGVTLFQVLTRKLPHGRGTPQELLQARKQAAPDLTGHVPKPLADLVVKLLDEDPPRRPQSAAEVASALSLFVPNHALSMPVMLGRARLVGRDVERAKVAEIVDHVKEKKGGAPRLVVVEGQDGVGKSRFVEELKAEVQLKGGRSAIGRCVEDVRWPYRPVGELLKGLAPVATRTGMTEREREVVDKLVPETSDVGVDASNPLPKAERERFHQAAADLFLSFGKAHACVLIVEDIPYCDQATLAMLTTILRRAHEASLLVVVTAATGDGAGPVPKELLDAAGGDVVRVKLAPLPRDDVGRLVAALLGLPSVPDPLVDTLMSHAEGSPLLVEELVALMIERGELRRGESGWLLDDFKSSSGSAAPILSVLAERVNRLSGAERGALRALAVFNRPSGPKLLAAVSGVDVSTVRQALSSTEASGLIRVVGEEEGRPRVVFRHPQIRDALLDELKREGSIGEWHKTCARVLEERSAGRTDPIAETLAHHYEAAGDAKQAMKWFLTAADHCIKTFAFDDAIALGRRASRLLSKAKADAATIARSDLVTGKAMFLAGRIPEARAFLDGAVLRTDAVEAPEGFGEIHVWLARSCSALGAIEQGKRAVTRALGMLSEGHQPKAVAKLLLARGELTQALDPNAAIADAEKALKLLGKRPSVTDELDAYEVLAVAAQFGGDPARSVQCAKHRVELSDREGRTLDAIAARRQYALALSGIGERLEARKHLNEALKLARESGHRLEEALLMKALGDQLQVSGAYSEAIARFQTAATLSAQMGQAAERADALRCLGACYIAKGDYDRAIDHLRAAMESFDRSGQVSQSIAVRCTLANGLIAKGELDEAQEVLRTAAKRLPEGSLAVTRAEVFSAQGNLFSARADFKRARIAYLNAIALCRRTRDQFMLGEGLVGYSQLLLRVGEPARAWRLARRAETIFTNLDARGQLKRIKPLLNATEGLKKASKPAKARAPT